MSPEIQQDLQVLHQMVDALTEEERKCPLNKLRTVRQLQVVALALALQMKCICELHKEPT